MNQPTTEPAKRHRRWFSISLRSMLLLILIVGGLMGWKARRAGRQRGAVARIERLGGSVIYDWQYGGLAFLTKSNARPAGPAWLRKIVGDDYFQDVVQVNLPANLLSAPEMGVGPDALEEWGKSRKEFEERFIKPLADDQLACLEPLDRLESLCFLANLPLKPEGIARLERLSRLKELNISNCLHANDLGRLASLTNIEILSLQVDERLETDLSFLDKMPKLRILTLGGLWTSDDQLAGIGQVRSLKSLTVFGPNLTDKGLPHLKDLKSLEYLSIILGRNLTGEGTAPLEGLTKLNTLYLAGMPMDGAGLDHLRKLPKLRSLSFSRGQLDDATIDAFKAVRPGVSISFSP